MKILTNLEIQEAAKLIMTNEQFGDFPVAAQNGEFLFKDGILWMYATIEGQDAWYPLTNEKLSYVHDQLTPSSTWNVQHDLGTQDLIYLVYDEANNVQITDIDFIDDDNINVMLAEDLAGRCVIFGAGDKFSGGSHWVEPVNANLVPETASSYDLGSSFSLVG